MSAAVSIVVPVHGRAALTRSCLDAVLEGLAPDCETVVVDDASADSTPELLAGYGEAIRVLTLADNAGYAAACNAGAAEARGELLVFLNNDTLPRRGWLDALRRHAAEQPRADIVGAKLLYPTGTVQHAGVAIGQDGYPHNLYAGFPADHPAVNRSRRLQAVTAACMLVRRPAFEALEGFDTGFHNSLEDVDLCLRAGERGGEVRYCHEAEVVHLESASRGRLDRFDRSVRLYRERWRDRAVRDDLALYASDDLIEVEYAESYPLRFSLSPQLAVLAAGERQEDRERLLETYARQVSDLLAEVVRLTAALGQEAAGPAPGGAASFTESRGADFDRQRFAAEVNRLEEEVRGLQERLEPAAPPAGAGKRFVASHRLGYRRLVERVRTAIEQAVPAGATVLVVSRGDRNLVELEGRDGRHFPQDESGRYLGHHPEDGADAVARLEALRAGGARYLVVPSTSAWWLDHYAELAEHLDRLYARTDADGCAIFCLERDPVAEGSAR